MRGREKNSNGELNSLIKWTETMKEWLHLPCILSCRVMKRKNCIGAVTASVTYVCIKMHVSDTLIGQTMESDAIKMRSIVKAVATHQINAHQTSKLAFAKRGYKQRKENAFDLVKPVHHSLTFTVNIDSLFFQFLNLSFFQTTTTTSWFKNPQQSPTTHKILPTSDITQKQRHNLISC